MNKLLRPLARIRSGSAGQAAVEFAFILLPLLLIFLVLTDGGLFLWKSVSVENSVREGARCAAVGGSTDAVIAKVQSQIPGDGSVEVIRPDNPSVGDDVEVRASWEYTLVTPAGMFGVDDTLNRTHSVTMRLETTDEDKPCGS